MAGLLRYSWYAPAERYFFFKSRALYHFFGHLPLVRRVEEYTTVDQTSLPGWPVSVGYIEVGVTVRV